MLLEYASYNTCNTTIHATTHQLYNCLLLTFTDLHTYMHIKQFCCCQSGLFLWITSCQLYHHNSVLLHQCIGAIDISLILSKYLLIYLKRVSIYCYMLATLEHNTSRGKLRLSTVLGYHTNSTKLWYENEEKLQYRYKVMVWVSIRVHRAICRQYFYLV